MEKRELLKLPMPKVKLSRVDLEAYKNKHGTYSTPCRVLARIVPGGFGEGDTETYVDADGRVISRPLHKGEASGILVVWILHLDGHPLYTIYASADSARWHVWSHVKNRWRTAMLLNLTGYCAYREHEYIYADKDSATLGHYFGSADCDTLRALDDFQRDNRTYRTKIAILNSRREIDALMASVPQLPADINRYIDNHVMKNSRYLWYKKEGKTLVGICSHCKKTVRVDKYPKGRLIDTKWKCPECHSEVTIKSVNCSAKVCDCGHFGVVAPVPGGIMLTLYRVIRHHCREDIQKKKPTFWQAYSTVARTHIKYGGHMTQYEFTCRNNSLYPTKTMWYVDTNQHSEHSTMIYPGNLKRVLADTPWRYTGLAEYAKADKPIALGKFLEYSKRRPAIEKMAKLGLYELIAPMVPYSSIYRAIDVVGKETDGNAPLCELLNVNKAELRMFIRLDITPAELIFYKQRRALGKPPTEKDIRELRAAGIDASDITDGDRRYGGHCNRYLFYTTYHKIARFVAEQSKGEYKGREKNPAGTIIRDWRDYLSECSQLGYNLRDERILMPKNLLSAHGRTSAQVKHEQNKAANAKIEARRAVLEQFYNFERDGYIIRMARDGDELITEGKVQNICVGGYIDKYANGGCTILLLRRSAEPEKPFVTIEVCEEDDNVRDIQIRAYRNREPDVDTMKWWRAYKKNVLAKLGGEPWAAEHEKKGKKKDAKKAS